MNRAINMMIMQGYPEEEAEEVEHPMREAAPIAEEPENVAQQAAMVAQAVDDKVNMMQISAAAYTGAVDEATISLLIKLKEVPAVALADTGSTNTFLDLQFAMDHDIELTPATPRRVKVAGGVILISNSIAYNHQFMVQGTTFSADFRILELKGSDAILGVNWFKIHNPVTFDFIERPLTVGFGANAYTFSDHLVFVRDLMVSAAECEKLVKEDATSYILYNMEDVRTTLTELEQTTTSTEFQGILKAFADVFQEPEGLPPHRSHDHAIPLVPGSKPPNFRPYRMSHNQKNTIENYCTDVEEQRDPGQQ
jgi:hypothetical protein